MTYNELEHGMLLVDQVDGTVWVVFKDRDGRIQHFSIIRGSRGMDSEIVRELQGDNDVSQEVVDLRKVFKHIWEEHGKTKT